MKSSILSRIAVLATILGGSREGLAQASDGSLYLETFDTTPAANNSMPDGWAVVKNNWYVGVSALQSVSAPNSLLVASPGGGHGTASGPGATLETAGTTYALQFRFYVDDYGLGEYQLLYLSHNADPYYLYWRLMLSAHSGADPDLADLYTDKEMTRKIATFSRFEWHDLVIRRRGSLMEVFLDREHIDTTTLAHNVPFLGITVGAAYKAGSMMGEVFYDDFKIGSYVFPEGTLLTVR